MLIGILGVLGLVFILGTSLMGSGGAQGPAANFDQKTAIELVLQAHTIRAELTSCMVGFPGDNATGFRPSLPAAQAPTPLSDLTCPGKPAPGNSLFGAVGAADLPAVLPGTQGWRFVNDATSARLELVADSNSMLPALERAKARLGTVATLDPATRTLTVRFKQ